MKFCPLAIQIKATEQDFPQRGVLFIMLYIIQGGSNWIFVDGVLNLNI